MARRRRRSRRRRRPAWGLGWFAVGALLFGLGAAHRCQMLGGSADGASLAECKKAHAAARAARRAHALRLATWNVRWFPDGKPGEPREPSALGPVATDLDAMACTLAELDVDAVALQEIKRTPRAEAALERVLSSLDELTGGDWKVELDDCAGAGRQHVGIAFDASRLDAGAFRSVAALNPHGGDGCDGMLRPGLATYFRRPAGADFHFVSLHLKSGVRRRDHTLRRRSIEAIAEVYQRALRAVPDTDVVLAGDFNTMGCSRCRPGISADTELSLLDARIGALSPPLRRVDSERGCSAYHRGRPGLLDHFVVTRSMQEVRADVRTQAGGYCRVLGCRRSAERRMPAGYRDLSDHCPAVLELDGRDLD